MEIERLDDLTRLHASLPGPTCHTARATNFSLSAVTYIQGREAGRFLCPKNNGPRKRGRSVPWRVRRYLRLWRMPEKCETNSGELPVAFRPSRASPFSP